MLLTFRGFTIIQEDEGNFGIYLNGLLKARKNSTQTAIAWINEYMG